MACFSPLTGYRPLDGSAKLTFKANLGYYDKPVKVACGQCRGCRLESARQWAVRCLHEAQMHDRNCFLTLTYSDKHIPADRSVNPRTFQLFAKRLRYWQGPFRFYHCGEYGEKTNRPHYHALMFGLDFFEDRKQYSAGHTPLYTADCLTEIWGLGQVLIGELTQQSAAYVARYSMKKLGGAMAHDEYGERVDPETGEIDFYRHRPYSTMSRNPGIGASWLSKYHRDVFPSDEVIVDGKKTRPPKYYDYLCELSDPAVLDQVKAERRKNGNKHKANNTPERLAVREEVLRRRTIHLTRDTN